MDTAVESGVVREASSKEPLECKCDRVSEAAGADQEPLAGGTRAAWHLPVLYSFYNIPFMAIDSS